MGGGRTGLDPVRAGERGADLQRPLPGAVRAPDGERAGGGRDPGMWPLMLSSSLLISRVSRTNRPCDPPGRTSPDVSQMQKVVPSSRVTRPPGAPIVVAGAPSNVQTWPIWCLLCRLAAPFAQARGLGSNLATA